MVYDENFAERVGNLLMTQRDFDEKKMFGGLTFMVNGHMSMGVMEKDFMLRIGKEKYQTALSKPNTREMDFTGKSMNGFIYISIDGLKDDKLLFEWIMMGLEYNSTLPSK